MASLTREHGRRNGFRVRVYIAGGRVSIWLGDIGESLAIEIARNVDLIASARSNGESVSPDVVHWVSCLPKNLRQKIDVLFSSGLTVASCVDEFVRVSRSGMSQRSHDRIARECDRLKVAFGERLISTISKDAVINLYASTDGADATKKKSVSVWRSFFDYAIRCGWLSNNPASGVCVHRGAWTYFLISTEGPPRVKIGFTKNAPWNRLSGCRSGSPVSLSLLGAMEGDRESELHLRFAKYRHHGEWFSASPEILEFIESHCASGMDSQLKPCI